MQARLAFPALLLALAGGVAVAQPGEGAPVPITPGPAIAPPLPPMVEIRGGDPVVSAHITRNARALAACVAPGARQDVRIRIAWDARGRAHTIVVHGGRHAFKACARKAVAGPLPINRRRGGAGNASVRIHGTGQPDRPAPIVLQPVPTPEPTPKPRAGDLHACTVDGDCTLHYRTSACIPDDPIAVSVRADPAAVRSAYPVRHIECGMGGDQYMELRMSIEGRYAARCEQARCVVQDHGPQPGSPATIGR